MALSDLGCLRIRLLVIRHSLFLCWGGGGGGGGEGGGGGGGGGEKGAKGKKKVFSLLSLKEKGDKDCLIAGYCQRHFVDFYHYISNITCLQNKLSIFK